MSLMPRVGRLLAPPRGRKKKIARRPDARGREANGDVQMTLRIKWWHILVSIWRKKEVASPVN
jgi:hypothetical protein